MLIETVPAAFEMDAILYELRDHCAGLNAGRWDYIFSVIKRFRSRPDFVLPDRSAVTMTVPFMHAYSELLVKTCHARGAHAMGGMSAVIPSRTDEEANKKAFEAVRADKQREAGAGFDGTWVAHPDSVPVATEAFDEVLGDRPNQVDKRRDDVSVGAAELLSVAQTPGEVTEEGLRLNVNVGIQYISSWLRGNGAAGDLRADGGRRDRGDLTRAGLAVDPPRRGARRRPPGHRRAGAHAGRARSSRRSAARSATTTGSRSRAGPTCRARCSSAWRSAATSSWSS